ncbi:nucleopolyhedrovirus P10 family protein [Streptomyces enissocaesilis]|uniref:Nucleopolyhedrovirus P10 family protein n=1 Tax=Streptomyces enissocaesilis TaxID=332589 RepID=A0ABP6J7S6_9ACTN
MAPDGWTRAVRQRLGLGRLLPLGEAADGAWLAEKAAAPVLRRAAEGIAGVGLGALRIGLADPDTAAEPAVSPPPSALPPGPLRIEADFTATAGGEPLPQRAERLRIALREAASARLGLMVTAVDLRVTDLVEAGREPVAAAPPDEGDDEEDEGGGGGAGHREGRGEAHGDGPPRPEEEAASRAGAAAAAAPVPGVVRLTHTLGAPVHLADGHVRVELAAAADRRTLAVALAVRKAVREAVTAVRGGRPTVAVLVTRVE